MRLAKDGLQVVEIERRHDLRRWIVRASSIRSAEAKVGVKFGDLSPIGQATCYSIHTTRQFLCNNQFVVTAEYRWGRKSIQWQDPKYSIPDADITVLLNTTHPSYPVWPGHLGRRRVALV